MEVEQLGLLSEIISDDTVAYSRKFDFGDFEKDIDFINQHAEDEEDVPKNVESIVDNTIQVENCVSELKAADCIAVESKIEVEKPFELCSQNDNVCDADPTSSLTEELGEKNNQQEKHSDVKSKRVVFDLPDIPEYSEDFDSECEEIDMENVVAAPFRDLEREGNCQCSRESLPKHQPDSVQSCNRCNCRLVSVKLADLPQLNSLFSKMRTERVAKNERDMGKCKRTKKKKSNKKDRGMIGNSTGLSTKLNKEEGVSKGKKGEQVEKRTPVQNFWDDSSDHSLLQWLKRKKKELRKKKLMERVVKREEKREQKIKEIEKVCQQQKASEKFDEWMQAKKQEERKIRNALKRKVCPVTTLEDSKSTNTKDKCPEGYTVFETFSGNTSKTIDGKYEPVEKETISRKKPGAQKDTYQKRKLKPIVSSQESTHHHDFRNAKVIEAKSKTLKKVEKLNCKLSAQTIQHAKHKISTKKELLKETGSKIVIKERPDPQGCDNPENEENCLQENNEVMPGKVSVEERNDLLEFLSEHKRPWMEGGAT